MYFIDGRKTIKPTDVKLLAAFFLAEYPERNQQIEQNSHPNKLIQCNILTF